MLLLSAVVQQHLVRKCHYKQHRNTSLSTAAKHCELLGSETCIELRSPARDVTRPRCAGLPQECMAHGMASHRAGTGPESARYFWRIPSLQTDLLNHRARTTKHVTCTSTRKGQRLEERPCAARRLLPSKTSTKLSLHASPPPPLPAAGGMGMGLRR